MTDELDLLEDLLDAVSEIQDNQDKTTAALTELLARITRVETRIVVLVNSLGHGDKIKQLRKETC